MSDTAFIYAQTHQQVERGTLAATWDEVVIDHTRGEHFRIGRNHCPAALWEAYEAGVLIDPAEIAKGLEDAWTGAEWPGRALDRESWCAMFESIGFIENDRVGRRPKQSVTLFRAALEGDRHGLAWTDDFDQAVWFHKRNLSFGLDSKIWTVDADPLFLLAHFPDSRNESEWLWNGDPEDIRLALVTESGESK
jgi:hypothetical protein